MTFGGKGVPLAEHGFGALPGPSKNEDEDEENLSENDSNKSEKQTREEKKD